MATTTASPYTEDDIAFLKALKAQGVSQEEAFARLDAVKKKFGLPAQKTSLSLGIPQEVQKEKMGEPEVSKEITEITPAKEQGLFGAIPEKGLIKGGLENIKTGISTAGEIVKDVATTAYEGAKEIGKGVVEQAKELTGIGEEDEEQMGLAQTAQGAFGILASPIVGVLENVPGGETILNAFSKPHEIVGSLFETASKVAGVDTTTSEFKANKDAFATAFDIALVKHAPEIAKKGGEVLKDVGKKTYETAFKPTTIEATLMQNYEASLKIAKQNLKSAKKTGDVVAIEEATGRLKQLKENVPVTVAETGVEKGIWGAEKTIGVEAKVEQSNLWKNEIEPALKESVEIITKEEAFKPIEDFIAKEAEPGRKADLQKAYDAIKEDYAKKETFTLEEAHAIKSGLDEFTPNKYWKGEDIASAYKQLKAELSNSFRRQIYDKLSDVNIKKSYLNYGNLKTLEKVGIKGRTGGGLKGGFGTFWSTIWEMATTPIKTVGGKYIYKAGDLLEFASSKKGIKTVGQYLLMQDVNKQDFEEMMDTNYEQTESLKM